MNMNMNLVAKIATFRQLKVAELTQIYLIEKMRSTQLRIFRLGFSGNHPFSTLLRC